MRIHFFPKLNNMVHSLSFECLNCYQKEPTFTYLFRDEAHASVSRQFNIVIGLTIVYLVYVVYNVII